MPIGEPKDLTQCQRFFLEPKYPKQRQYEALRRYFVEGRPSQEVAAAFGYTQGSFRVLCHQFRRDPEPAFFLTPHPGPRTQPKKSAARALIEQLRKQNHSVYEIAEALKERGTPLSATAVGEVLRELGFAPLPRRLDEERPVISRPTVEPVADARAFSLTPRHFPTRCGGLFLFLADLVHFDLDQIAHTLMGWTPPSTCTASLCATLKELRLAAKESNSQPGEEESEMNVTTIGLDIAKNVFQAHGVDQNGKMVVRKRFSRAKVLEFFANLPPCLIGMEACPGAHYWARELMKLGHAVKLMAAQYVKAYLKGNKNDGNDAEAICEAVGRPGMRFVAINTEAQQDTQMLHRIRSRLVCERTALINQVRGLLGEYGIVFAQGPSQVRRGMSVWLGKDDPRLSGMARELLADLNGQLRALDERIANYDARVKAACATDERSQKLAELPGIGPLTATALAAAVNDGKQFDNGRQMAASLGLTPREHSSGGKQRLMGITKRGNTYVRTLLIHGARTVLRHAEGKTDRLSRWALAVQARRGANVAAVALANKLARIAWAVLARERSYEPDWAPPAAATAN